MRRLSTLVGMAIFGMALLVGTGTSQDAKKDPEKIKGQLPPGWKGLGLSKDQVLEIYKVQTKFKAKIKALEDQIKEAKSEEKQAMVKVLTEDQKEKLRNLVTGESPKDKKSDSKVKDKS
jgi:Spy/CpxP family protein refolding chaperone